MAVSYQQLVDDYRLFDQYSQPLPDLYELSSEY
nr:MAG TPA: hypothetical protein [Caudoviricetes sp.]